MATNRMDELIAAMESGLRKTDAVPGGIVLPGGGVQSAHPDAALPTGAIAAKQSSENLIIAALPGSEQPVMSTASPAEPAKSSAADGSTATSELGRLTAELQLLRGATSQQTETLQGNTQALIDSLTSKAGISASGVAGTATKMLSNSVGSLFGISPILSGIMSLFGAGKTEAPAPLVDFSLPQAIKQEAGLSPDNSYSQVTYGESGTPKTDVSRPAASPSQITVQVQAMDSRSFLDRSDEIARAVKEAMLHSHSLNDVVVDL